MDQTYISALAELGVSLATMAASGTATAINSKIKAIKAEKDSEKIRNADEEIINELIAEREEAIRIAQVYKAELDRLVISDEDISHLHTTVSRLLDLLKKISPNVDVASFEMLKNLISVDTLKTMQLLGFNYKAAIGEPLTEICANAIANFGNRGNKNQNQGKKK